MDQRFCKSCGFGLQVVSDLMTGRMEGSQFIPTTVGPGDSLEPRRRILERLGIGIFGVAGLTVLGAVIGGVVKGIIIEKGQVWSGIGIIAVLLGIVVGAGLLGYAEYLKRWKTQLRAERTSISQRTPATARLPHESEVDTRASVTEHTTEFLVSSGLRTSGRDEEASRE